MRVGVPRAICWTRGRAALLALMCAASMASACNRGADGAKPAAAATPSTAAPVEKPSPPPAARDSKFARWNGATPAAGQWPTRAATDVLVLAAAPGLDGDAVDAATQKLIAALRKLAGVEHVVTRARPGEWRAVVRFGVAAACGSDAEEAVLAAWRAAPPAGLAAPQTFAIVPGARALAALQMADARGRHETAHYADAHTDGLIRLARTATRSHIVGAARPLIALRPAPGTLANYGIGLSDITAALRKWLATPAADPAPPTADAARAALQTITLKRHWTLNGDPLPPAPLDKLVEISLEQGEPTREARNGPTSTTFWLLDGNDDADRAQLEAAVRQVAQESQGIFRPTTQVISIAVRFVVVAPDGKEPEPMEAFSKRLADIGVVNPSIVALNAMGGLDGVPELLDVDSRNGRRWTLWASIAGQDASAAISAARELLIAGGWEVHVLSERTDTALAWVLDAWGASGAVISASDPRQLATAVGQIAQRALGGRSKAVIRQGPQPGLAPPSFRRIDPTALAKSRILPSDAQDFGELLTGMTPLGWWHDVPVWLGFPVGDLAGTIGQTPLNWQAKGGTGTNQSWLGNDVLRIADQTPSVDRVRFDGRSALWSVPDAIAETPQTVAGSFWPLVEAAVDLRAGMRIDPIELGVRPLVAEGAEEPSAP